MIAIDVNVATSGEDVKVVDQYDVWRNSINIKSSNLNEIIYPEFLCSLLQIIAVESTEWNSQTQSAFDKGHLVDWIFLSAQSALSRP